MLSSENGGFRKLATSGWQTRLLVALVVAAIFTELGLWRFHEVLFTPGLSLTNFSDGVAAIGGIRTFAEDVQQQGWTTLLGDQHRSLLIGAGLQEPVPFGPLFKLIAWSLGSVSPPDNAWDLYGLLGFILMGLAGYLLTREVGASRFAALAAGLLLVHLDAFHARLPYHLFGLGVYYLPLFAAWAAVRAGRQPSWGRLTLFAGFMVLNFLSNEYYGYFGTFFLISLFAGYGLLHRRTWRIQGMRLPGRLLACGLLFAVLMVLVYPHQIGARLLGGWVSAPVVAGDEPFARTWPEFVHYSTLHPLYIFRPANEWLASILPDSLFREPAAKQETWEFSYRIGLALPVLAGLLLLAPLVLGRWGGGGDEREGFGESAAPALQPSSAPIITAAGTPMGPVLIWLTAALVVALFGISPEFRLSLVPFTYAIAPMFRVGARAFLYVDMALVMIFALALSGALTALGRALASHDFGRLATGAVGLGVAAITLADVSSQPLLAPLPARVLPDIAVYAALENRTRGPLLELPLFSPLADPPEINSFYVYHRVAHGQPLINFSPANPLYAQRLHELAERLAHPDEAVLGELKRAGIRYLAARRIKGYEFGYRNGEFSPLQAMSATSARDYDFSALDRSPLLTRLASDGAVSLYEFADDGEFGRTSFAEAFIFRGPVGLTFGSCGPELSNAAEHWRWCGQTARIRLDNRGAGLRQVTLSMQLSAPGTEVRPLRISGLDFANSLAVGSERQRFERVVTIPADGRYELVLHYEGPDVLTPVTGGRHAFRIFDLTVNSQ